MNGYKPLPLNYYYVATEGIKHQQIKKLPGTILLTQLLMPEAIHA